MHPLAVTHWTLVQKRTQIRHDKRTLLWIQRCWQAARRCVGDSSFSQIVTRDEYDGIYKRLLTAMTIEWRDDDFRAIVDSMWCRDASAFTDLNEDRFSCSIFSFAEMWVESVEVSEYARVLQLIHRLLSSSTTSDEQITRHLHPTSLTAFLDALIQETQLASMNVSIGKSPVFDPEHYDKATQTDQAVFGDAVAAVTRCRSPYTFIRVSLGTESSAVVLSIRVHGRRYFVNVNYQRPHSQPQYGCRVSRQNHCNFCQDQVAHDLKSPHNEDAKHSPKCGWLSRPDQQ